MDPRGLYHHFEDENGRSIDMKIIFYDCDKEIVETKCN